MITFTIPMPPSVNNSYANVAGVGRVKGKELKAWLTKAGWEVKAQMRPIPNGKYLFTKPVAVDIQLKPSRGDIDNRAKAVLDLATSLHIWRDDNLVYDLRLRWANVEGCQVTISEIEA